MNFAGRGPKHFGDNQNNSKSPSYARPDSVIPKPVALASDSEDDDVIAGLANNEIIDDEMSSQFANDADIDHSTPVNTTTKQSPKPPRTQHSYCLICYTHNISHYRSILPCGHDDICAPCMLRLRYLDNDTNCPVCKSSNEIVIVDKDNFQVNEHDASDGMEVHHKKFNQYELWGNEILSGGHPDNQGKFIYKEDVGMHFPKEVYDRIVTPLCGYACGMEGCTFVNGGDSFVNEREVMNDDNGKKRKGGSSNGDNHQREVKRRLTGVKALKAHLRMEHGMTLCDLCVDNKRNFVYNLERFTPQGLKKHENDKQEGHPMCEFCRPKRFYDIVKLHEHLNKEHYKCHICEKQGKVSRLLWIVYIIYT